MANKHNDLYPAINETPKSLSSELLDEGLSRFGVGDTAGAIRSWRDALELEPGNPVAIDYLRSAGLSDQELEELASKGPGQVVTFEAEPADASSSSLRLVEALPAEPRHAVERISQPMPVVTGEILKQQPSVIVAAEPALNDKKKILYALIGVAALCLGIVLLLALTGGEDKPSASANAGTNAGTTPTGEVAEVTASTPATTAGAGAGEYFDVIVEPTPKRASVYIDGEKLGRGEARLRLPKDGAKHTIRIEAPGFEPYEAVFVDVPPRTAIVLSKASKRSARNTKRKPGARRTQKARPDPVVSTTQPADPKPATATKPTKPTKPATSPTSKTSKPNKPSTTSRPTDNKNPWEN